MAASTRICLALALATSCACLAACGENADQRAVRSTVDRFYAALKGHDARTACRSVSPKVARAMVRALDEPNKPCVPALEDVFRIVATSPKADPHFFDSVPTVKSVLVKGDHAVVTVQRGYQRRRMGVTRVGDGWQITGSPSLR